MRWLPVFISVMMFSLYLATGASAKGWCLYTHMGTFCRFSTYQQCMDSRASTFNTCAPDPANKAPSGVEPDKKKSTPSKWWVTP